MFRNQYDTDITTFSPAGRLHQVEYAMEAVKQGSAAVGVHSRDWVVVASIKRSSEMASYQQKVYKLDKHCGMAAAGLISDARVLSEWMRNECLNHRYVYDSELPTSRLVARVSDKSQVLTQREEKRPYGVGLLVAGYDQTGAHLFQTEPSGLFYDYRAQAIGARSQSAKTYLEKHFQTFEELGLEELIFHALTALKGASQKKLTSRNVTVGYVGKGKEFTILEGDSVRQYVLNVTQSDDEDDPDDEKKDKDKDKDAEKSRDETMETSTTSSSSSTSTTSSVEPSVEIKDDMDETS